MRGTALLAVLLIAAPMPLVVGAAPAWGDPAPWRQAITTPDRKRLSSLWKAWGTAKTQVVAAGRGEEWAALGDLADPAALPLGELPQPGEYRCRTVKLGTRNAGMPVWAMGQSVPCRFEMAGDRLRFVTDRGAQRTAGLLHIDGERIVYLGAVSLGSESGRFGYGRDAERDQVGVLNRIGPARWRLELPWPRWESTLDVVEIVPAG